MYLNSVECVDDIITNGELATRSTRPADHAAENLALNALALEMAERPHNLLQRLADVVIDLCHAESSGVSIYEEVEGRGVFRWYACSGEFGHLADSTLPFDGSPCGTVVTRNATLMMERVDRYYPAVRRIHPPVTEIVLAPFHAEGKPIGTVWAICHSRSSNFDAEDVRVLNNLSRFAAAGYQSLRAQRQADDMARSARENEAFLRRLLESSGDCIKTLDLEGRIQSITDAGRRLLEVDNLEDILGRPWADLIEGSGKGEVLNAIETAQSGGLGSFQAEARTFKGKLRFWDVQVTPVLRDDGAVDRLLSISRDITGLKEAELQREQLMKELAHRMRNSLAMVQAIVTQTFRQNGSSDEIQEAINGRISALSNAQDMLTQTNWGAADIRAVVQVAIAPHRDAEDRFVMQGPSVTLNAQQGLGLSLAIHELSTNAVKYGALSTPSGRIYISWALKPDGSFDFLWKEAGGPTVEQPTRAGFGSRLLTRMVAPYFHGRAAMSYVFSGVEFQVTGQLAAADTTGNTTVR